MTKPNRAGVLANLNALLRSKPGCFRVCHMNRTTISAFAAVTLLAACAGSSGNGGGATTQQTDTAATAADSSQQADASAAADTATGADIGQAADTVTGSQDAGGQAVDAGISGAVDAGKPQVQITALDAPAGKGIPTFSAVKDTTGKLASADTLKGQWTVIWFYPAASTFG